MKFHFSSKLLTSVVVFMLTSAMTTQLALAEDKKDKSVRRAAQMMQQMKQQAEQEKAAMQTQFDTQKKELESKLKSNEEVSKKLQADTEEEKRKARGLQQSLQSTKTEKAALETKLQQAQTALEASQKNLTEMTAKYQQAQADLKVNEGQRKTQLTNLSDISKSLQTCEAKNEKLYQFGLDLTKLYEKPAAYAQANKNEQFAQMKRVEIENILQDYRDKVDAERISQSK